PHPRGRNEFTVSPGTLAAYSRRLHARRLIGDESAEWSVPVERAQGDRPVRDVARAVRGPVNRIEHHGHGRVGRSAPPRLLADYSHARLVQDGKHRGVGDEVERVLARLVGPLASRGTLERLQRFPGGVGGACEQREKLVVCHGGTLLRTLDAVADEVTGRV